MKETTLHFATKDSLETVAQALAEGEHAFGAEATAAGYAILMWPSSDCPWFHPGPAPITEADEFRWRWNYGMSLREIGFDFLPF